MMVLRLSEFKYRQLFAGTSTTFEKHRKKDLYRYAQTSYTTLVLFFNFRINDLVMHIISTSESLI